MKSLLTFSLLSSMVLATLSFSDVGLSGVIDYKEGATIFNRDCAACHTLGGSDVGAPDLAGVNAKRSKSWLHSFIKSPQAMIDKGDPIAIDLVKKFDNTVMPDTDISDDHIDDVLGYIQNKSNPSKGSAVEAKTTEPVASTPVAVATTYTITTENILLGQKLFQGTIPLTHRGVTCIACHHVSGKSIISGGSLAKDLTKSFTRIGEQRISSIIANPPFPTMKQAYKDHAITGEEVSALTAFLVNADRESAEQPKNGYGIKMIIFGVIGLAFILGVFSFIFRKRKKRSVNQDIYDRQMKSE